MRLGHTTKQISQLMVEGYRFHFYMLLLSQAMKHNQSYWFRAIDWYLARDNIRNTFFDSFGATVSARMDG